MVSFVLQYDSIVNEAADGVPNEIMLRVLVLITCTDTDNYDNGLSYMIVMVIYFE